jgi:undecaprenyl-phosphate galactose phosphotransferase
VQRPAALRVKHAADRAGAVAALAALSPLIGLIAWRIRREDGGPVFFRQQRAGLDGRPFELW